MSLALNSTRLSSGQPVSLEPDSRDADVLPRPVDGAFGGGNSGGGTPIHAGVPRRLPFNRLPAGSGSGVDAGGVLPSPAGRGRGRPVAGGATAGVADHLSPQEVLFPRFGAPTKLHRFFRDSLAESSSSESEEEEEDSGDDSDDNGNGHSRVASSGSATTGSASGSRSGGTEPEVSPTNEVSCSLKRSFTFSYLLSVLFAC